MQTIHKYAGIVVLGGLTAFAVLVMSNSEFSPEQVILGDSTSDSTHLPLAAAAGSGAVSGVSFPALQTVQLPPELSMPVSGGLIRVTKKPFGLKVSPEDSPVSNDIFSGYHTGIDFETTSSEQDKDVAFMAACNGKVILKTWAKGYGGLLVQACQLAGQDVNVIYGHVKLDSITAKVGDVLAAGDEIGYLGQGNTAETDGRRKHLHFDIHRGTDLNIRGYVSSPDDLANWIDPVEYLQ